MPNYDDRVIVDGAFGNISGGVNAFATSLTSPQFASLPSGLSTVRYLPLVLADDAQRLYEVVWVTAHSESSQTVTVVRGREGSTARSWGTGTLWRCGPTVRDLIPSFDTRAGLPADPQLGMRARIVNDPTGVTRVVEKVPAGWRSTDSIFGHAGMTSTTQSVGTVLVLVSAQELQGGMTFSNGALVVPIAGRYDLRINLYVSGTGTGKYTANVQANAAALVGSPVLRGWKPDNGDWSLTASGMAQLAAGDALKVAFSMPANTSLKGTTGYDGCWLEAIYLGP